jgi:hypothetical protein
VSDQKLRRLERAWQSGDIDVGVFEQECRRSGAIGPTVALGCRYLIRLAEVINHHSQEELGCRPSNRYPQIRQILRNVSWSTSQDVITGIERWHLDRIFGCIFDVAGGRQLIQGEPREAVNAEILNRYLPPILAFYLFVHASDYPRRDVDGVEGVVLRVCDAEDIINLVNSGVDQGRWSQNYASQFEYRVRIIEEGHIDEYYESHYGIDKYEELAKLLPPEVYSRLETDWKENAIRFFPKFGDFLVNQYKDWFDSALAIGYEVATRDEMDREVRKAINGFRWGSGAISFIDEELSQQRGSNLGTVIIWLSLHDLQNHIRQTAMDEEEPFDDLLESLEYDSLRPFQETYYEENMEVVEEYLRRDANSLAVFVPPRLFDPPMRYYLP